MERIDSKWFSYLMAYWEISPYGEVERMLGKVCEMICLAHGIKHDGKVQDWEFHLPSQRPKKPVESLEEIPVQDPEETKANLRAVLAGFR